MDNSTFGRTPWRFIAIQVLIVLGLVTFLKVYLPYRSRNLAAQAAATREQRILSLFQDSVEEDPTQEISVPLEGAIVKRHPQRLRSTFSREQAEATLGLPSTIFSDFGGGEHLTWIGTSHRFEAAFNAGSLYCLTLEDRTTGHGALVYESPLLWHPY
jgi:hypothetical protein